MDSRFRGNDDAAANDGATSAAHSPAPSPLDLDRETMRRLGHRVADVVAEHLSSLRQQPVLAQMSRRSAEDLLMAPPPERGTDIDELLATLEERVFAHHAREPHPGFLAYVPSCPTFPAVLGDWLATGFNFFAGVWPVAAGPNELELVVLAWFRGWLGMPPGTGGLLTSGGSAATLTAVVAARHEAVGDDPSRLSRLVMYTSTQAHSSVVRAGWIAGVQRAGIRQVPVNADYTMRADALAAMVDSDRRAGLIPFILIANAGTTNTGAVDPLHAIADLCARERMWMHVDAAYAGFSVLTRRGAAALDGIGRADSVTLDPHKWLFVPFECGCLLARDPSRLTAAFRIYPEYLKDVEGGAEEINFADYGEQLTRYARALKVWLSVSYFGITAIAGAIDRAMDLAEHAERLIREAPDLELLSPARFGIVCFRVRPGGQGLDGSALDALNQSVNAGINDSGRFFISSTRLDEVFALRICVLGFRTTADDVEELIREIVAAGRPRIIDA